MKKRFTEAQIAFALRQASSGTPQQEPGRWVWLTLRFAGVEKINANPGVAEIGRLKQLEDDNRRLRHLMADPTLDKRMLQDVLSNHQIFSKNERTNPLRLILFLWTCLKYAKYR